MFKNILKKVKGASGEPSGKEKWILKIMEESGLSREETIRRLNEAKDVFGIKPGLFYRKKMWDMTPAQMARKALHESRKAQERDAIYEDIQKNTGKTKEQSRQDLEYIKGKKPAFSPNTEWYYRYGAYNLELPEEEKKLSVLLEASERMKELRDDVRGKLPLIDAGELSYEDIEEAVAEYRSLTENHLSELKIGYLCEKLRHSRPDIMESEEARRAAAADMLWTMELFEFYESEYISLYLYGKSVEEKRTYMTSVERARAIRMISSPEAVELLNDKYEAYRKLEKYYGREILQVEKEEDFGKFCDFVKRHPVFVKKNGFDSLGRGISKVSVDENTDLKALFDELTDDIGPVIMEELIIPGEAIRKLNPDSVNTVRMITYAENGRTEVLYTSMKVGRKGSFVDNGGAGGILVHLDKDTGSFDTQGIDEHGLRYDSHPDHGYDFIGYTLPDWEKAKELAREAILDVDGLSFVGWDLTYTADDRWVIVEGNPMSQFIGAQGTIRRGLKREFYDTIHYEEKLREQEL